PKAIADGWLQMFDGETTFGWKIDGDAKVVDGALVLGGAQRVRATPTTRFAAFELRLESQGAAHLVLETANGSSAVGLTGQKCVMTRRGAVVRGQRQTIEPVDRIDDGVRIDRVTFRHDGSGPLTLRLEVPAGGKFVVRSIQLRPLGLQSLFNGKD